MIPLDTAIIYTEIKKREVCKFCFESWCSLMCVNCYSMEVVCFCVWIFVCVLLGPKYALIWQTKNVYYPPMYAIYKEYSTMHRYNLCCIQCICEVGFRNIIQQLPACKTHSTHYAGQYPSVVQTIQGCTDHRHEPHVESSSAFTQ